VRKGKRGFDKSILVQLEEPTKKNWPGGIYEKNARWGKKGGGEWGEEGN